MIPEPVLPTYAGANIRAVLPYLLGPRRGPAPAWMPSALATADQVVVLVLDGLGWRQLADRAEIAPTLTAMQGGPITSVVPSTTATALTSITTGLTPGEHGVVGYRIDLGGSVVNMLRWHDGHRDVRQVHLPADVQPFAPFLGDAVPVITKAEFERTGFTEAHLRGGRMRGWRLASAIPILVASALAEGHRVVYAYYDGVDKVSHERGFGAFYDAELANADALVAAVTAVLPAGAVLAVTADHGQVQVVGPEIRLPDDVLRLTRHQSGEGRFRWLHAASSDRASLLARCQDHFGDVAWVISKQQCIDEGWFGPVVSGPVAGRLGDVALVPFADVSFFDPLDSGPYPLVCRHGSLTAAEMLVPLLASR